MAESKSAISTSAPAAAVSKDMMVGSSSDVSTTNVQVLGVDESEIVKTDGTYIYYFNESDRAVYVVLAAQGQAMQTVKKIRLPETFFNAKLYLANGKLTILASRYDSANYGSRYWYYR